MYVQCNTEGRSCNHCYSGRAKSVTYYECMFVALVIKLEKQLPHIIPGC